MRADTQLGVTIPEEVRVFQQAIYKHNASLYDAEKIAQGFNSRFNIVDWVNAEGWYETAHVGGPGNVGPGIGDPYLAQQVERQMATVQQEAAEQLWSMDDREGAREMRTMDIDEFTRKHMDHPLFKQQDPLNINVQEQFRGADLRYRDQMVSDNIPQLQEEMKMKSEINKDFNKQLGDQLDTMVANEPDTSYGIGDDIFGLDATLVKADRVWDEVDTQLDQMLKDRVGLYRQLEETMEGLNIESHPDWFDADHYLETPEWSAMNRTSKLDYLARDLTLQNKALAEMRNIAEQRNAAEMFDEFDEMALNWEAEAEQWGVSNHSSMEALDSLLDKIGKKPLPKDMQSGFNEMYDHAANREWSSTATDVSLQGTGADGLINDAYNAFGIDGGMRGRMADSRAAHLIEAGRESNLDDVDEAADLGADGGFEAPVQEGGFPEEYNAGDVEPYDDGWVDDIRIQQYDDMLAEPLLGDPAAARLNPNLEINPNFNRQAGMEIAEGTMMEFLGMIPIGVGGLQPDKTDYSTYLPDEGWREHDARMKKENQQKQDWEDQRARRANMARETWIDADTYVNIAGRWFKATVKDMFFASPTQPQTRFDVEVEWDDKDGKTMDYIIPASSDRIRLQEDGPPPLREGGISRYEPFTDPQDIEKQTRHVDDILPLEQVFVGGRWREVKEVDGDTLIMSDGYKYLVWAGYPPQWRARGVIDKGPKFTQRNKLDPKAAAGTMMVDSHGNLIPWVPKSGPKGRLKAYMDALQKGEGEKDIEATDKHSYDEVQQHLNEWLESMGISPDELDDDEEDLDIPGMHLVDGNWQTDGTDGFRKWVPKIGEYFTMDQEHPEDGNVWHIDSIGEDGNYTVTRDDGYTQVLSTGFMDGGIDAGNFGNLPPPGVDDSGDQTPETETPETPETETPETETETPETETETPETETETPETETPDTTPTVTPPDTTPTVTPPDTTPTVTPPDTTPTVNLETGHAQEDIFPGTAESMKHKIDTGGFHALEKELGMSMPEIYENYALGKFDWQHDTIVPEWLQPNLSKLHGGTDQYESLINKYSDNHQMMQNLERVGTAVRAPGVLNYLDTAHNELRTVYHNGLSHDQIHNITQSNMPNFSYNSAGHIVLQDDLTIDHQFNHNREVVHSIDPTGATTEHTQLDFQKVAAEYQQQHQPSSHS